MTKRAVEVTAPRISSYARNIKQSRAAASVIQHRCLCGATTHTPSGSRSPQHRRLTTMPRHCETNERWVSINGGENTSKHQ
uniref:Uncharacterized protein n=1 Tax=Arundo donax TaxID=35708 RepID=A0A0A9DD52_ARUDO